MQFTREMYRLGGEIMETLFDMDDRQDIIKDTHGGISACLPGREMIVIKPSGMKYSQIHDNDLCWVSLADGSSFSVNGRRPSVDTPHHLKMYRSDPSLGAICHTHSPHIVARSTHFSPLICYTTEQADYFGGDISCMAYGDLDLWSYHLPSDLLRRKAIILQSHGLLTFGKSPAEALKLAIAAEMIAEKNYLAETMYGTPQRLPESEIRKWHERYTNGYGQK